MSVRAYRTFQALILGALGLFLLFKVSDGRILLYINQRFVILVLLAGLGLMILAQVVLRERPPSEDGEAAGDTAPMEPLHDHGHGEPRSAWGLWLLALPLLLGLFIPQRALGAAAIYNRGVNLGAGLSNAGDAARIPAEERNVLDWARLAAEGALVHGERADVTGFVYHDPRLGEGMFLVSRFTIACCVADAVAYGVAVRWSTAQDLPDNRWVRVRGTVAEVQVGGRTVPLITAEQVEVIPEPEQPYLFP